MELLGNLKDKVANAKSSAEAKGIIEKAGMRLTNDELKQVTGGVSYYFPESDTFPGNVAPGPEDLSSEQNMRDPFFPGLSKW